MVYNCTYFIRESGKASDECSYEAIRYGEAHLVQQRKAFEALEAGQVSDEEYDSWIKTNVEE